MWEGARDGKININDAMCHDFTEPAAVVPAGQCTTGIFRLLLTLFCGPVDYIEINLPAPYFVSDTKVLVNRPVLTVPGVSACIIVSMLAACVPSHRDQVREFASIIKRELAGDSGRLCAMVDELPYPDSPYPAENYAELHAMARAGIVESYNGPDPVERGTVSPSGNSFKLWRLTHENDPSFVPFRSSSPRTIHGCYQYGRLRLIQVQGSSEFTSPTNEKVTRVFFTYRIDNLAKWAQDPELRQAAEDSTYSGGHIWPVVAGQNKELRSIELVATAKGWKVRPMMYAPHVVPLPSAIR